jgi:ribosomal protein L15E
MYLIFYVYVNAMFSKERIRIQPRRISRSRALSPKPEDGFAVLVSEGLKNGRQEVRMLIGKRSNDITG